MKMEVHNFLRTLYIVVEGFIKCSREPCGFLISLNLKNEMPTISGINLFIFQMPTILGINFYFIFKCPSFVEELNFFWYYTLSNYSTKICPVLLGFTQCFVLKQRCVLQQASKFYWKVNF